MAKTVDELRNEIREAVGRYERIESTSFTKEALVAICEAVDADIDTATTPPKPEMRGAILDAVGIEGDGETAFRKAQLQAIAEAVEE
ncbi:MULTISPECIES: hypothetical protein [Salinibaculum]|uniref:hypothetical protein n=1 Tax=Salinibaculum TaxID=2732368 RepID=UPI0030D4BC7D